MKRFNITGKCIPERHYMVDISDRIERIKGMVDEGDYFCINRGRQYGKTTTLSLLKRRIEGEYSVFSLSFEGIGDASFETDERLAATFLWLLCDRAETGLVKGLSDESKKILADNVPDAAGSLPLVVLKSIIGKLCSRNDRGVVLLIDEVDQAGNFDSFVKLLGLLRDLYLNRDEMPTFQSVILAGVYDIRNLQLKIRPESAHQFNSPWNIATPLDEDLALKESGIEQMLHEYAADHGIAFDGHNIAHLLYDYTNGYPYMVSRLCMLMEKQNDWSSDGFLLAAKSLYEESNTLFSDTLKKLDDFPRLRDMLYQMLFCGKEFPYVIANREQELARLFDIVQQVNGKLAIANRIYETWLYNKFIADEKMKELFYDEGVMGKQQFVQDNKLNMPLILERFCHTYTELYKDRSEKFDEDEGRKKFIFFMKPIINGTGNYYVEARTRGLRRTDLIIDYLGQHYIIEMKIWHGQSYNEKGELQLSDYLKANDKAEGYMLTFCFNKSREQGATQQVIDGKTITEFVV